jgi:hypothetical protein
VVVGPHCEKRAARSAIEGIGWIFDRDPRRTCVCGAERRKCERCDKRKGAKQRAVHGGLLKGFFERSYDAAHALRVGHDFISFFAASLGP